MTDVSSFDRYLQQQLEDPTMRAAFEDYESRRALVLSLVTHRKELGLTQREVAHRMGVKQPMVSGFENEDTDPRLSTIFRYARAVKACISMYLDVETGDGGWRRESRHRGWRPARIYRPFPSQAHYESQGECQVIPLHVSGRWQSLPPKVAHV